MAINRWVGILLLLAFVPASSVLGLVRPMTDKPVEGKWDLFGDVWQANLFGDLMFVLGTVAAGLGVVFIVRYGRSPLHTGIQKVGWMLAAVAASVLFHWAVYALSWSLTLHPYLDANIQSETEPNFWGWDWDMLYSEPLLGLESAWTFTWCWGWAGLVFSGLAVPLGAWILLAKPWVHAAGRTVGLMSSR